MESRTILKESRRDFCSSLNLTYSIIANRLPLYGGFESDRVTAKIITDHILVEHLNVVHNFYLEETVGIFDLNDVEVAEQKMYEKAKEVAEARAEIHKNQFLDITSRGEYNSEEYKLYCGKNWGS